MTEERGPYDIHREDPEDTAEPERIGDILHRLIDQRGWPPRPGVTPANGDRPGAGDAPRDGDA